MPLLHRFPRLTFALTVSARAVGCGGGEGVTVPPTTGTLEITTSTSGAEQDADGSGRKRPGTSQPIPIADGFEG